MSFPRYAEYKPSGVEWLGEVPENWVVTQLKRIVSPERPITYGIVQAGPNIEDGVLYIRPADMTDEQGISDESALLRTSPEIAAGYTRSTIQKGDLVCSIGPSFGKVMEVTDTLDGANLTQGTARVAVFPAHCSKFIFWVLRSTSSFSQWESSVGGATFRALNLGPLAETLITVPPCENQTIIAAFLDSETGKIGALIAEQQRLVKLLAEKRQAVISHAVTKGLNPNAPMKDSGIEWLGEVPEHWGVGTLTRVAERIIVGIAEAATHAYAEAGTPILRATNVRAGKIIGEMLYLDSDFADDRGSKLLNAGDLVTVRTGNAGVTAVVPRELDGCQCFTMLITTLIGSSVADFYCYWMNSVASRRYFSLEGWGTAQINISVPILKCLPIPIPTFEEQQAIVAFLDSETAKFDALTAEANRAIALLQERRSALISAAVTGKIDVCGALKEKRDTA